MNKVGKIIIVAALVVAVVIVIVIKQNKTNTAQSERISADVNISYQSEKMSANLTISDQSQVLPRLVDLGADKCIPCKMMAPMLEELKKEYAGIFNVEFIDVWKNPDAGKKYSIRIIPTQIFFDVAGKEMFRHEGFFSKKDILTKWKELSVDIEKTQE